MKRSSPLWGSVSVLIGVVIAILALVRGAWLVPLLLLTFTAWGLWVVMFQLQPAWDSIRGYRKKEHDARKQREASLYSTAQTNADAMQLLLRHVNHRISAYLVATDRLYMDTYGDSPVIRVLDREGIDQIEPLEIQQTAHQQIGTYLDIPSKYYDRMLQRDPALLSYNVNRWFQKEPEQKLLRTMDGKARAFLSNRYRRIDNLDIARVVLPIIGEMEGARFESCEITDDRMYLKVVNPRLQAEVIPGDIVQAGIMISNSETGLGAVNIQPLIYRLVCSNGMVVNEAGTRRAHIGRVNTTDVNFALYSQQTLDAEDRTFVLKIQDTVRAAVDEARFSTVLERMRESKQAQLNTQDLPGLVKLAGSSFGILEEEGKGVLQHLIEDGDFTLYGLANAVTRFSQDVESYDRATKLEEIGYSVMTMSPLLLQKINQTQVTKLAA